MDTTGHENERVSNDLKCTPSSYSREKAANKILFYPSEIVAAFASRLVIRRTHFLRILNSRIADDWIMNLAMLRNFYSKSSCV